MKMLPCPFLCFRSCLARTLGVRRCGTNHKYLFRCSNPAYRSQRGIISSGFLSPVHSIMNTVLVALLLVLFRQLSSLDSRSQGRVYLNGPHPIIGNKRGTDALIPESTMRRAPGIPYAGPHDCGHGF